jgi:glycine betaine/choline ABC-type transport system substrate-binding protein
MAFTSMTEAVKDVAQAIRENKPTDFHPELYKAIMDVLEYSSDALMAALNHLVDHKAQGVTFVAMADSQ